MTGFGRGEAIGGAVNLTVEIKSVNHRYLDISIRLPKEFNLLEEEVRGQIRKGINRGRVDAFVRYTLPQESVRPVTVNLPLARMYLDKSSELKQQTGMHSELSLADLLRLPEVVQLTETELDAEALRSTLITAVERAVQGAATMREQEGIRLSEDMGSRLDVLADLLNQVDQRSPQVVEDYRGKLESRLQELLQDNMIEPSRLAQEVVMFADRSCIAEEIVRLRSHFDQFRRLLKANDAVGRKLDFLVQEMNREVNTIGSKANDAELAILVVDMKSELEKIREQAQNIE